MHRLLIFVIITLLSFNWACKKNEKNTPDKQIDTALKMEISENVKNIIYLTPSPTEIMLIINNANPDYYDSFLNPPTNSDKYETTTELALNLGVYTADLSFLSMFEQAQKSINYIAVTKKLAEKLGLLRFINDSTIKEIQNNIQNRDKVLNIITEVYDDINTYLSEDNQMDISSLIIYGAWIEGIYIAINLINDDLQKNQKLLQIIYDQKVSLEELLDILKAFKKTKTIKPFYQQALEIYDIFKNNKSDDALTKDSYFKLKQKIFQIRKQIVKD